MWAISLVLSLFGVFAFDCKILPLPPYLKACQKSLPNFDDCALEQANLAIPYILKGDPKYGIPNLVPLELDQVNVLTGGNLKINFQGVKLYGLDRLKLTNFKINLAAQKVNLDFAAELLNIQAKYEINGKILVLPLEGNGDANITATGLDIKYELTYKLKTIDGEEYMNLDEQNIDFTIEMVSFYFDNLFNGDDELGANTNKLLNEEWKSVLDELKPAIAETIATVASSIVNGIFDKIPYKFLLP
ncbi:hypothetical protein JTB14_017035 [Gonioctena quinquepunctata]|nr:hypothetical protein JTB14_017035 [Gonioctena quinquepunctata]